MRAGYMQHVRLINPFIAPATSEPDAMTEAESAELLDEVVAAARRQGWRIPGEA